MTKSGNAGFSKSLLDFINAWKEKPGNLIMILHHVQEEQGFISKEAAMEVARLINVPVARVFGVVSFYHFFKTEKPGKNLINVCLGTACYLKGGQDILDELRAQLKIEEGATTTKDGLFSVEPVRCIGCCGLAPVISVNGDVYGKLTKNQVKDILAQYNKASA
ncbi:MAG: NAD(P)H-dependent oxidoreductase subunit E [Treponema sp.]|nr:NAD(P)H-dependent oxidoreductase subunit E [Treponema sp.]